MDFRSAANYSSIFKYSPVVSTAHDHDLSLNEESSFSRWTRRGICFFCYLFLGLTFPATAFFCLKKIPALERLVVFRLGILQQVRGPGWAVVFPWLDRSIKVDLQPLSLSLPSQQLMTSDGAILEVGWVRVHYRVCDVVRSVMQVKGLEETFSQLTMHSLVNVVSGMDYEDLQDKPGLLQAAVLKSLNSSTVDWGLEVTSFQICPFVVLQEARPRNGISQVISAVQSALGLPDQHCTGPSLEDNHSCSEEEPSSEAVVRRALADAPTLPDGATLHFHIDDEDVSLLCTSPDGTWRVSQADAATGTADVNVRLTRKVLLDIVSGRVTPAQAYCNSQVTVSGNPQLLAQILSLLS